VEFDAYSAGAHAFKKDAWVKCPYMAIPATEEHQLVDCMKKEWSNKSIMSLAQKPANGVGYIKVQWSGGVCANVWKNAQIKEQQDKASFAGYSSYVQLVLRNLHFLQKMNGGSDALDHLRETFPGAQFPNLPPEEVALHVNGASAKCRQWDILVELNSDSEEVSPDKLTVAGRNHAQKDKPVLMHKDIAFLSVDGNGSIIS